MKRLKPATRRGNAHIEFALCGVFIVFLLISIAEMARGLWIYHTLGEAVRDGTRYAITRGERYVDRDTGQRLVDAQLEDVRQAVWRSAIGLDRQRLSLKFESQAGIIDCTPSTNCPAGSLSQNWPPDGFGAKNLEIGISASYPYNSFVVMYFPGGKPLQFGKYVLGSIARERIVY